MAETSTRWWLTQDSTETTIDAPPEESTSWWPNCRGWASGAPSVNGWSGRMAQPNPSWAQRSSGTTWGDRPT